MAGGWIIRKGGMGSGVWKFDRKCPTQSRRGVEKCFMDGMGFHMGGGKN